VLKCCRLARGARRGAQFAAHPRELLELAPRPAAAGQLRCSHEHDLVLSEQLAVELRREDEGADDPELGAVGAHELERVLRLGHVVVDLDPGIELVELRENPRQQVQPGRSRRGQGKRADPCVAGARDRAASVREQRLCPEHVVGKQLPLLGELCSPCSPRDQPAPDLELELGDLFRDCGLADVELFGRPRKRAAPGHS